MEKNGLFTIIFSICLLIFTGCAGLRTIDHEIPVPEKESFTIKFKDTVIIQKKDFSKELKRALDKYLMDKDSQEYFNTVFDKHIKSYADPIVFEKNIVDPPTPEKVAMKIAGNFSAIVEKDKEKIHQLFHGNNKYMRFRFYPNKPVIFKSDIQKDSDSQGRFSFNITFVQPYKYSSSAGNPTYNTMGSNVMLEMKYEKIEENEIKFSIDNISIKSDEKGPAYDSNSIYGSSVDSEALLRSIRQIPSSIHQADAQPEYKKFKASIIGEVKKTLNSRCMIKSGKRLKKEEQYSIRFEVAMSRLQRELDRFKYSTEESTFQFIDKKACPFGNSSVNYKTDLNVKLFPETNGKTAIIFEIVYNQLFDTLTNRNIYGQKDAEKLLSDTIASVSSILK